MDDKKYVFAGNRAAVLKKMMEMELNIIRIWAVKKSFLQRYLDENSIEYTEINDKNEFLKEIEETRFDYFISNGLPIILPIKRLRQEEKEFINIHPSLLPELRGKDPIPGALLYGKPIGVTCHYMDDGIDSGDIIEQIEIDHTEDLEAGLLYQMSFMAEAEVFEKAYARAFQSKGKQELTGNEIYYSFSESDLEINLKNDSIEEIIARVNAFATRNKGAVLRIGNEVYKCWQVQLISNQYMNSKVKDFENNTVAIKYENKIIAKKGEQFLKMVVTPN